MTTCADIRLSLGVYVVGAIEPAERTQTDLHLAGCPLCRDELASLAGLPALLGHVTEEQIMQISAPPAELLDNLLAAAARERGGHRWLPWTGSYPRRPGGQGRRGGRRRSWWSGWWLAVAAALVVVGLVGGLAVPRLLTSEESGPGSWTAIATDPATRVRANVTVTAKPKGRGSALRISMTGLPPETWCEIWAVGRDGMRDLAGGWETEEDYGRYGASTVIKPAELASLQIVTGKGKALVTIRAPG